MSDDRWDAFARRHGVVYHHSGWLRALERECAHESIALLCEELTHGLDLVPSLRSENLRRLGLALEELGAECVDRKELVLDETTIGDEPLLELRGPKGELKIVPEPAGTPGGYDDLRRAATREPIGKGLRPSVASIGDLARMLAALDREHDGQPSVNCASSPSSNAA